MASLMHSCKADGAAPRHHHHVHLPAAAIHEPAAMTKQRSVYVNYRQLSAPPRKAYDAASRRLDAHLPAAAIMQPAVTTYQ
jgi:hypothetical protein